MQGNIFSQELILGVGPFMWKLILHKFFRICHLQTLLPAKCEILPSMRKMMSKQKSQKNRTGLKILPGTLNPKIFGHFNFRTRESSENFGRDFYYFGRFRTLFCENLHEI